VLGVARVVRDPEGAVRRSGERLLVVEAVGLGREDEPRPVAADDDAEVRVVASSPVGLRVRRAWRFLRREWGDPLVEEVSRANRW
jgi:hypothetical protein